MALALLGALFIGLSLGLLGSGGSLLTLPILVFVLGRPEQTAFAESLAIVGLIALAGAIPYAAHSTIHWKGVILLGFPGMLGAYGGAYLSHYIGERLHLQLFACLMLVMAAMMIFPHTLRSKGPSPNPPFWATLLEGGLIGALSGCMGIGGGGLIVAALVLYNRLPISTAVGTSLVIITLNSTIGLFAHLSALHDQDMAVNWKIILVMSMVGAAGSCAGNWVSTKVSPLRVKQIFGINTIAIGLYMLLRR